MNFGIAASLFWLCIGVITGSTIGYIFGYFRGVVLGEIKGRKNEQESQREAHHRRQILDRQINMGRRIYNELSGAVKNSPFGIEVDKYESDGTNGGIFRIIARYGGSDILSICVALLTADGVEVIFRPDTSNRNDESSLNLGTRPSDNQVGLLIEHSINYLNKWEPHKVFHGA